MSKKVKRPSRGDTVWVLRGTNDLAKARAAQVTKVGTKYLRVRLVGEDGVLSRLDRQLELSQEGRAWWRNFADVSAQQQLTWAYERLRRILREGTIMHLDYAKTVGLDAALLTKVADLLKAHDAEWARPK